MQQQLPQLANNTSSTNTNNNDTSTINSNNNTNMQPNGSITNNVQQSGQTQQQPAQGQIVPSAHPQSQSQINK